MESTRHRRFRGETYLSPPLGFKTSLVLGLESIFSKLRGLFVSFYISLCNFCYVTAKCVRITFVTVTYIYIYIYIYICVFV